MRIIGEWFRRISYLLNRDSHDAALREEMLAHRERMSSPARFGNARRLREEAHDVWGWGWLDDLTRDARYAVTMLRRAPGFGFVAVASLALAIGATTAIFSVVNGVILRPLPFDHPDQLVEVFGRSWREERAGAPDPIRGPIGWPELDAYRANSTTFAGLAGYAVSTVHLNAAGTVERLMAIRSDRWLMDLLGARASVGRTFRPDDPADVAVISASLWARVFGSDPALPGRVVTLDGRPVTIVGVMPAEFQFPYSAASVLPGALPETRTEVWLPVEALQAPGTNLRRGRMSVVGRLKPDVDVERAQAELKVIAAQIERQQPGPAMRVGVRLEPLRDVAIGPVRRSLWLMFAAVGLVLAAACANVANLLLARMTVRIREVATRAALGASQRRLFRQFLAESLLLSLLGGIAGLFVARWGTRVLTTVASLRIPRVHEVALDWQAFGFLAVICAVTAVAFGLAPAIAATRIDIQGVSRETSNQTTLAGRFGRLRDVLVIAEVTLAFVLAAGAVAVIGEMQRLAQSDPGMDTRQVLTLHLTPRATADDYAQIEARVRALPGITAAGFTQLVPLQNWGWVGEFTIKGEPPPATGRRSSDLRYVTPGYFDALKIPILKGRNFTSGDTADAPRVVVVNDILARRYFPNTDPVGRELDRGTIIGVIGDVRQAGLDVPVEPEVYYHIAQNLASTADAGMSLIVRATGDPAALAPSVRAAIADVKPGLAVFNIKTMDQVLADSLWELTLYRWLIGAFAALALTLAAIGLHGVIAYSATVRMREFAVRLALGSEPTAVARLVVSRALRLAGAGLLLGLGLTTALARLAGAVSIVATPGAITYGVVSATLVAVAVLASAAPAFRVLRVNPAVALRHD